MASIMNIGTNALLAFQRVLVTTGNNVANVDTEGYSRQRVDLTTQIPQKLGNSYVGSGVRVANVRRMYDEFLGSQVRHTQSAVSDLDAYYKYAVQIDNMIADPDIGVDTVMQEYFDALQGLSDDPGSTPTRELLLSESRSLVDRFHYLHQQLEEAMGRLNSDIDYIVEEVNRLAEAIAEVNSMITASPGLHQGIEPNDLLDKRGQMINDLSQYLNVSTVEQDDGSVNVYFGKGQSLVLGEIAARLEVLDSSEVPGRKEIGFSAGGGALEISDQVNGGELGGLLRVRDEILDEGRQQLGLVAMGLAFEINVQHREGVNLLNQTEIDFFTDITTTQSIRNRDNDPATDYQFDITVTDPALLQASDYRLTYNGGGAGDPHNYTLLRLSDNTVISPDPAPADTAFPWDLGTKAGFTLALDPASTSIAANDSFLIRPVVNAAENIDLALTDAREIAAAGMLRSEVPATNLGTGTITPPTVVDPTDIPLEQITLTYSAGTITVSVPDSIAPAPAPFAYVAGAPVTLYGVQVTLNGAPQDGDSFILSGGISDNRNALAMADLQHTATLLADANGSPTASFQDSFGNYVATTGSRTRQAGVSLEAQEGLLQINQDALQAIAGVNLDEEAADLVRFQQAYQAAAKVITTAQTVFDSLIAAVR